MNISISNEFQLLSQELQQVFSLQTLKQIARQTGFVQRTSKYRAQDLSALCIGLGQDIASHSLNRLCGALEENTGILMSPEGLNQRFNANAVTFYVRYFQNLYRRNFYPQLQFLILFQSIFVVFVF